MSQTQVSAATNMFSYKYSITANQTLKTLQQSVTQTASTEYLHSVPL